MMFRQQLPIREQWAERRGIDAPSEGEVATAFRPFVALPGPPFAGRPSVEEDAHRVGAPADLLVQWLRGLLDHNSCPVGDGVGW